MSGPLNSVSTLPQQHSQGRSPVVGGHFGPVPILTGNGFVPWVDAE